MNDVSKEEGFPAGQVKTAPTEVKVILSKVSLFLCATLGFIVFAESYVLNILVGVHLLFMKALLDEDYSSMSEPSLKDYHQAIGEISSSTAAVELNRVPNDLNNYRHRIDANVEEQRKYREVLEDLQDKVLKYRQKAAESDICHGTSVSGRHSATLSSYHGSNQFTSPEHHVGSGAGLLHVMTDLSGCFPSTSLSCGHLSAMSSTEHNMSLEILIAQIHAEQSRSSTLEDIIEMLRAQTDAAAEANYYLKEDLIRMQEALKTAQQELHFEQESSLTIRKKFRLKSDTQCKNLLDLWMICNKLKKQMKELKMEAETDLDRQKTEFVRCANNMERLFRENQIRQKMSSTKTASEIQDSVEEVMKKYDEIVLKNVKIEHEKSEIERKFMHSESAEKRLEEERDNAIASLRKIQQIPELSDANGRRARSISPAPSMAGLASSHDTTVRQVRRALKGQQEEIKSWRKLNDEAEERLKEMGAQLRSNDKIKKEVEKVHQELLRTNEELKQESEEHARNLRRLADRSQRLDQDKTELQSTIKMQTDQIHDLKSFHQKTIDDLSQFHRDEWEKQRKSMDGELEEKDRSTESRFVRLRKEIDEVNADLGASRQEENNLRLELTAEKRRTENCEREAVEASRRLQLASDEQERLQKNLEEKEIFIVDIEKQLDEVRSLLQAAEAAREELQSEKTILMKENSAYVEEITELRSEVMQNGMQLETQQTVDDEQKNTLKTYKEQVLRHETIVEEYKLTAGDLEHQIEIANTECETLRNELTLCHTDVEKLSAIIKDLNRDKLAVEKEKEDLYEEVVFCKKATEEYRTENESLLTKVNEMDHQIIACHEQIETFKVFERELSQRLREANAETDILQDRIHKMELRDKKESNELECSQEKLAHMKAELGQLDEGYSKKVTELIVANESLTQRVSELNMSVTETNQRNERLNNEYNLLGAEYKQSRVDLEAEIERIRKELSAIIDEHKMEQQEWEDYRAQMEDAKSVSDKRLAENVEKAQQELEEASKREEDLRSTIGRIHKEQLKNISRIKDLEEELTELNESFSLDRTAADNAVGSLRSEKQKLDIESKEVRIKFEREKKKVGDCEKKLATLGSQLEKKEKSLKKHEAEMVRLEDDLRKRTKTEAELEFKLSNVTRELQELHNQKTQLKTAFDKADKENHELNKSFVEMRTEISVLQSKISAAEEKEQKKSDEAERIRAQMKDMEFMVEDKKAEITSLSLLVKHYEKNQQDMLNELQELKETNNRLQKEAQSATKEKDALNRELISIQRTLERKTETNQKAVNDLLDNYRLVEKEKVEVMRVLDDRESELDVVRARLVTADNKRRSAEGRAEQLAEEIRKLTGRLNHFENSAKKALTYARAHSMKRHKETTGASIQDLSKSAFRLSNLALEEDIKDGTGGLRPSSSFVDVSTTYQDRLVHENGEYVGADPEKLNIRSSVEITFKILKDRIDELEREKNETSTQLLRVRTECDGHQSSFAVMENRIRSLEKQVQNLERERTSLETKLASSRQILLSQEESLLANDSDRRAFKAKMVSADLHSRDKDARLQVLGEQITVLRCEISRLEKEKQQHMQMESKWDVERNHFDHQLSSYAAQVEQLKTDCSKLAKQKESLTEKLHESERNVSTQRDRCLDLERTVSTHKETLTRMQNSEDHFKTKLDGLKRNVHDIGQMEKRLETMRMEMDSLNNRYKSSEHEREQLRREFLEIKSKYNFSQQKINDQQQTINELSSERKRAVDRLEHLERYERDSASLEKDLRRELEGLRSERLTLSAELEDSKRKIQKLSVEKREVEAQRSRLDRERAALKTHIQALDLDKQRIEASIRQTTAERQALDKSLNAMEKENSELYRNCSLLQSQVAQLERDNLNKAAESQTKKKVQLEGDLSRINHEKRQLEKVLEQREQNYTHKSRMFEAQISNLREQLDIERRRLRDQIVERAKDSTQSLPTEARREISVRRTHSRTITSSSPTSKAPFRV